MPITILLIVLLAGIFSIAPANAADGSPRIPLAPDLTWNSQGESSRTIQLSMQGDAIELPGVVYAASESFATNLPTKVLKFYSNVNLFESGWKSHNAFQDGTGTHQIFFHEKGYYLSVDTISCDGKICLAVWMSKSVGSGVMTTIPVEAPAEMSIAAGFTKLTPEFGAVGIDPYNAKFTWTSYAGADRYSYCVYDIPDIAAGNCGTGDPNWTGSFSLYGIKNDLNPGTDYEWKLRASTCWKSGCKEWQGNANGGTPWPFSTDTSTFVTISGTAKLPNVLITFDDGVETYTAVTNSTGVYKLKVPFGAAGTLTPAKAGYSFSPLTYVYPNINNDLTLNALNQNFLPKADISIGGKTGVGDVTVTFTGDGGFLGVDRVVQSSVTGVYTVKVPYNWAGTIVASKAHYNFTPANYSLGPQTVSSTNKNFTATAERFNLTGTVYYGPVGNGVGLEGVSLSYMDGGVTRSVMTDAFGEYTLNLPYGWSGDITPSKSGHAFIPTKLTVSSVLGDGTLADIEGYQVLSFASNATYDGEVIESGFGTGVGGTVNSAGSLIRLGDTGSKQQLKGILSFNTTVIGLDPTATFVSAKLQMRRYAINKKPFLTLGDLNVEVVNPYFGSAIALQSPDFQDPSLSLAGVVDPTIVNTYYYLADLTSGVGDIDFSGTTQLRLEFATPTDGDTDGDYVTIYSGNSTTAAYRPILQVLYYIP